jgi:hypothetical protein
LFDNGNAAAANKQPNGIIYAKKYYPAAFFTPIVMFLTVTFLLLLVIRILVTLLTMAVGMMVLLLLMLRVLQEFFYRPLKLLRAFHQSPVRTLSGMGALLGICQAFFGNQQQLFLLSTSTNSNNESTKHDMVLLWGLLEGLVYGIELGALWLVVLGDASDPSFLTKWMVRTVWRRIQIQYRESMQTRRRMARLRFFRLADDTHTARRRSDASDTSHWHEDHDYDRRRQCMICLENFSRNDNRSRQHLPCLHGFHADCLQQWMVIKPTCPICRVPIVDVDVDDTMMMMTMTTTTTTTTTNPPILPRAEEEEGLDNPHPQHHVVLETPTL